MHRSRNTPRGKKRRFSRKAAGALARSSSERGEIVVDLRRVEILARCAIARASSRSAGGSTARDCHCRGFDRPTEAGT